MRILFLRAVIIGRQFNIERVGSRLVCASYSPWTENKQWI